MPPSTSATEKEQGLKVGEVICSECADGLSFVSVLLSAILQHVQSNAPLIYCHHFIGYLLQRHTFTATTWSRLHFPARNSSLDQFIVCLRMLHFGAPFVAQPRTKPRFRAACVSSPDNSQRVFQPDALLMSYAPIAAVTSPVRAFGLSTFPAHNPVLQRRALASTAKAQICGAHSSPWKQQAPPA
jgi:hypothetical protein